MCGLCAALVRSMCGVCAVYVRSMCGVCAVFVRLWCGLCAVFARCLCYFGATLVRSLCYFGAVFVLLWCDFGAVFVLFWCDFSAVFVLFWWVFGAVFHIHRTYTAQIPEKGKRRWSVYWRKGKNRLGMSTEHRVARKHTSGHVINGYLAFLWRKTKNTKNPVYEWRRWLHIAQAKKRP